MVNQYKNDVIVLVGMSGVGKSTIGKALSERMGIAFLDVDELITSKLQMSINDFFIAKGEDAFRVLERQCILGLKGITKTVIATGGGALISPKVMDHLLQGGTVIYLEIQSDALASRLNGEQGQRPMVKDLNEEELKLRLSDLLDQRASAYKLADFTIDAAASINVVLASILTKV